MPGKAEQVYRITGTVINRTIRSGIAGLRVEAWDKDRLIDDLVGSAVTNGQGKFQIEFTAAYFKELFLDRQPDLYFRVFRGETLIKSTEDAVMWNVAVSDIQIKIEVDLAAAPTPPSPGEQPVSFSVSGQIQDADGDPLVGVTVRAVDQAMRSEAVLGEASTDQTGHYAISYSADQLGRPDKTSPNLVVRVLDAQGQVLAASPTRFNASPVETVDLVIGSPAALLSEYETLLAGLQSGLQTTPITDLTEDDINYLSGETGANALYLVFVVLANRYSARIGIPPEAFYACFRQKLPTRMGALLLQPPDSLHAALDASIAENIVPASLSPQIDVILATLAQPTTLVQAGDQADIPALAILSTTSLTIDQQAKLLGTFAAQDGSAEDFWQMVRQDQSLSEAQVKETQLTLQLGVLTRNHAPLIREIQALKPSLNSLRDLASMQEADWLALIDRAGVPTDTVTFSAQAVSSADQNRAYAQSITQLITAAFPSAVMTADMTRANYPDYQDAIQFFANCPDFEFDGTRIDDYLAAHTDQAVTNVKNREGLVNQLKTLQRVYQITPHYEHLHTLLSAGLNSALSIASTPQSVFIDQFAEALGGVDQATAYYARAAQISETSASVFVTVRQSMHDILPMVIGKSSPNIALMPNFTSLFGSQSLCDCDECSSVYGAAAYLVDLLQLINPPSGQKAIHHLRQRRPDIEYIQLTCENTETELPYIDLVNEIMEFYVASGGQIDQLPAHNTIDVSAEALSVTPQHTNEHAYDLLQAAVYPPGLPFNRPVTVARAYLEHLGSSRYEIMHTLAAATSPEIEAEYLKITAEEYQILTGKTFDGSDVTPAPTVIELYGYAQPTYPTLAKGSQGATVHVLQYLLKTVGGQPALEITGTFGQKTEDALTAFQHAHQITQSAVTDAATWAAFQQLEPNLWRIFLARMPDFLQHTGLSYADLLELLATHWVNPDPQADQAVVIHAPDEQCDLDKMTLQRQDGSRVGDDLLRRMHNFIRLWRKLGWAMADLDQAINALNAAHITPKFLQEIASVERVQAAVRLPLNQLLCLWSPLDTDGRDALYMTLFQNKALLNPVDDAFSLLYAVALDSLPQVTWPDSVKDQIAYDASTHQITFIGSMSSTEKQDLLALSAQASYQRAIEQLFAMRWYEGTELAIVTANSSAKAISSHTTAILAALRITDADLALIRAEANLAADDAPLNLRSLSVLYRHTLLAKGLTAKDRRPDRSENAVRADTIRVPGSSGNLRRAGAGGAGVRVFHRAVELSLSPFVRAANQPRARSRQFAGAGANAARWINPDRRR